MGSSSRRTRLRQAAISCALGAYALAFVAALLALAHLAGLSLSAARGAALSAGALLVVALAAWVVDQVTHRRDSAPTVIPPGS